MASKHFRLVYDTEFVGQIKATVKGYDRSDARGGIAPDRSQGYEVAAGGLPG